MERVKIGKITKAAGLKGEVKVYNYSGERERYERLSSVFVGETAFEVEKVRYVKDIVVLKLFGIDDRNAAEEVRGKDIYMDGSELGELPDGSYYIRDMIGLSVFDDVGNKIGDLSDVIQNRAQDLYEVETTGGKKILIPAVEEFILNIDIEKRRMDVKPIEGLI